MSKNFDKRLCARLDIARTPEEFVAILGIQFAYSVEELDLKEFVQMNRAELRLYFKTSNEINKVFNAFAALNEFRNGRFDEGKTFINHLKKIIRERKNKEDRLEEAEFDEEEVPLAVLFEQRMDATNKLNLRNIDRSGRPISCSLHSIVISGHPDQTEAAIKVDPSAINKKNRNGYTPLMYGMINGVSEAILPLLYAGARPFITNEEGMNALAMGVEWGHAGTTRTLLNFLRQERGDESMHFIINAVDTRGRTLLHYAAEYTHKPLIKLLLENGANPNIRDENGETPLSLVAKVGSKSCVQMLLEANAMPLN